MNSLQFTLEDSPLMSIESPGIIDVSSDSGEEFLVQPGDLPVLQERFRVGGPRTDAMTAFMGAASATLFPPQSVEDSLHETIDTAGTNIERQLMEVIDEHNFGRELSSTSFIDTEFEDSPMSPPESERPTRVQMNSYGRPRRLSYQLLERTINNLPTLIDPFLHTPLILQTIQQIFKFGILMVHLNRICITIKIGCEMTYLHTTTLL